MDFPGQIQSANYRPCTRYVNVRNISNSMSLRNFSRDSIHPLFFFYFFGRELARASTHGERVRGPPRGGEWTRKKGRRRLCGFDDSFPSDNTITAIVRPAMTVATTEKTADFKAAPAIPWSRNSAKNRVWFSVSCVRANCACRRSSRIDRRKSPRYLCVSRVGRARVPAIFNSQTTYRTFRYGAGHRCRTLLYDFDSSRSDTIIYACKSDSFLRPPSNKI